MHSDETAQALVQAAEQADFAGVPPGRPRDHAAHGGARRLRADRAHAEESGALNCDPPRPRPLGRGVRGDQARLRLAHVRRRAPAVRGEHQGHPARRAGLPHFGIPVEAELGKIPDADEEVDWQSYYTDVAEAERFVKETGVDWLAISVGIVHGVPLIHPAAAGHRRIREIRDATGIPLVLHGASGRARRRDQGGDGGGRAQAQRRHRPAARVPRGHRGGRGPRVTGSWRRRWPRAAAG